jgi:hypothetical protein
MRNADQTIRDALKNAQAVLCQYLEPGGPNENQTVKQLFGILNDQEVIRALEDSKRPRRQPAASQAARNIVLLRGVNGRSSEAPPKRGAA